MAALFSLRATQDAAQDPTDDLPADLPANRTGGTLDQLFTGTGARPLRAATEQGSCARERSRGEHVATQVGIDVSSRAEHLGFELGFLFFEDYISITRY